MFTKDELKNIRRLCDFVMDAEMPKYPEDWSRLINRYLESKGIKNVYSDTILKRGDIEGKKVFGKHYVKAFAYIDKNSVTESELKNPGKIKLTKFGLGASDYLGIGRDDDWKKAYAFVKNHQSISTLTLDQFVNLMR